MFLISLRKKRMVLSKVKDSVGYVCEAAAVVYIVVVGLSVELLRGYLESKQDERRGPL
jgi:hypothetical protein